MRFSAAVIIFFISFTYSFCKDFSFDVSAGVENMSGYTLYKIGGDYVNPDGTSGYIPFYISQLKFPINIFLFNADINLYFQKYFQLKLNINKNINTGTGKMEDSDWGYWYLESSGNSWASENSLDIFSESDAGLNTFSIEGILLYSFFNANNLSMAIGGAFLFEYYYYEINNLKQWYPSYDQYKGHISSFYAYTVSVSGKILTYELNQYIPYIAISGGYETDFFNAHLMIGISPYMFSSDIDDHVLRSKKNTANASGYSFIIRSDAAFNFLANYFVKLKGGLSYSSAAGNQEQTRYADTDEGSAGSIATIGYTLETFHFNIGLEAGYKY